MSETKEIRDKILEIADIAGSCPENLQGICFEALLKHYLAGFTLPARPIGAVETPQGREELEQPIGVSESAIRRQDDIRDTDLHVKVKRFMQKENVPITKLNDLFYKEGEAILPLYEDLRTTKTSSSQIRIALLRSLLSSFQTGEFEADVEGIRQECIERKCYDVGHFVQYFRSSSDLFDFEKFDKTTKTIRLSDSGRKALADLIKELN